MSTRATFLFPVVTPSIPEITLLMHHDGYPAAAADYLRAMLQRGGLVDGNDFFRVNTEATIVAGHGAFSNTSYRYTLTLAMQVLVERRLVHGKNDWEQVYRGDLLTFVNRQPGPCLYAVALGGLERLSYLTLEQLCQELAKARFTLQGLESGLVQPLSKDSLSQARLAVEQLRQKVGSIAGREARAGRLGREVNGPLA